MWGKCGYHGDFTRLAQNPSQGTWTIPNNNKQLAQKRRERRDPSERILTVARPVRQVGRLPFGDMYEFSLPYSEQFYISGNGTSGVAVCSNTYRPTNMYDVRVELGGAQPMQYDLLALVYRFYRVTEVHAEITFSNPERDGAYVGYRVRNSKNAVTTAGQTIGRIAEMDHTEVDPLNNTGSQIKKYKFAYKVAPMLGYTTMQASGWDMGGTFSGSSVPSIDTLIEPFVYHSTVGENNVVFCTVNITMKGVAGERQTYPAS